MKKILIGLGSIALALAIFTGGVYAANQGWLNFTGDEKITQSDDHLDEIMDILRQVNDDKMTAEDALAELEAMNPPGLVKKIKELEDEIEQLKTDNAVLVTDLNAKETEINDKQSQIEALQNERDGLQTQIDELQTIIDNFDDNSDYVQHLEEQLSIANQKVDEHHNVTESALNEAREISGGDE